MGDVHKPAPPPNAVGARVAELIEDGHALYATAVTGSPQGRVRRPTLFALAILGVGIAEFQATTTLGFAAAAVALIAILLLALTDNVVEL